MPCLTLGGGQERLGADGEVYNVAIDDSGTMGGGLAVVTRGVSGTRLTDDDSCAGNDGGAAMVRGKRDLELTTVSGRPDGKGKEDEDEDEEEIDSGSAEPVASEAESQLHGGTGLGVFNPFEG